MSESYQRQFKIMAEKADNNLRIANDYKRLAGSYKGKWLKEQEYRFRSNAACILLLAAIIGVNIYYWCAG